jgi:NAD(P)H dehydrogenase (quinone)
MSVVVTGATGQLGRLVIESLLNRGVPAGEIVATGRSLDKIKDFADRGVRTVASDYNDPESLRAAFAGADKVLLISASDPGQRVAQHTNAIEAAKAAGVGQIVYTSIPRGEDSTLILAADHQATEAVLRESGIPFTLLRNSWYHENYTAQIPTFVERGVILGSAGDGQVSGATRADYAEAAAAVLTGDDHAGKVYELGGDEAFTQAELAAEISAQTGKTVTYQDVPVADYQKILLDAGLPEPVAALVADIDRGVAGNELLITTGDLSRLIGRPTTPLSAAVAAALPA